MCGIVGAAAQWLSGDERERCRELMIVSNLRGFQGAGMIAANNLCTDVRHWKTVGTGIDAAYGDGYRDNMGMNKPTAVLIGHTRWPTKGKVDLEATHPHIHDDIYGVHNGTLKTILGKDIPYGASDSSMLYEMIAQFGVEEVIPEVEGAYALVWIDKKEQTLNFLRNKERPLYFATVDNGTAGYWASEAGQLSFVLNRHGIKHKIEALEPDVHMKIFMPLKAKVQLHERELTTLKGYTAAREVAAAIPFLGDWKGRQTTTKTTTTGSETSAAKTVSLPAVIGTSGTVPLLRWSDAAAGWVPKDITEEQVKAGTTKDGGKTPSALTIEDLQNIAEVKKAKPVSLESHLKEIHSIMAQDDGVNYDVHETGEEPFFVETIKNHHVAATSARRFLENDGCAWCSNAVPWDKRETVQWVAGDTFVCESCAEDDWNRDYISSTFGVKLKKHAA